MLYVDCSVAMWSHSVTASSVTVAVRSPWPRFWDWSLITMRGGYKMGKSRLQNFLRFKTGSNVLCLPQGCANPLKFTNICISISEICEFDLEEVIALMYTGTKHSFFYNIIKTTNLQIKPQMCKFLLVICELV